MLLWQMFSDYDLQWKDEVPVKGVAYHQYFAVKSELLGIVFRYHFFGIMNQDFIIALAN